jgi:hypothetical protein
MRFGEVIDDVIKFGHTARRECWPEGFHIGFRLPDDKSDLTGAYFYQSCIPPYPYVSTCAYEISQWTQECIRDKNYITVPWTPDTFDMTAHDWIYIK